MTIKEDIKIYSANPLYHIFEYFKEINGNKYITLVPINESNKKPQKNKTKNSKMK